MLFAFGRFGTIDDRLSGVLWSGPALGDAAERRLPALRAAGAGPGTIVALTHGGTAAFLADLFAVWRAGAAAACLDPDLTPGERETVLAFADPVAVLAGDGTVLARNGARTEAGPALDAPALILFTSGTTGAPKGVVLGHRALLARLALNRAAIGDAALSRTLVTLPTHFGHGLIGNALTALTAGGDIVLHPRGLPLARRLGPLIDEAGITFMSSVPALWRLALRMSARPADQSLARVHVGSAPLSAPLWTEIAAWSGAEVVNCYGITETANWIAGASSRRDGIADGLVGRPWGGDAAVLDGAGRIAAEGSGEIVLRSPALMTGYLGRPDLDRAAIIEGWYRTGDQGSIDAAGAIRLSGRLKDEINRAGFKIQPAEIDMLLETHPAIAEACTFGMPDAASGEIVGAAVRLTEGASETAATLRAWCLERLRREAAPERWFLVDAIPRTARDKVSREAVRRAVTGGPR